MLRSVEKPWAEETSIIFEKLESREGGLVGGEVNKRLQAYGRNEIKEKKAISKLDILLSQFKNFLVIILIAAALVSALVGFMEGSSDELIEATAILIVIAFIVLVGFIQEYRAEKEMEALKKMVSPRAVVVRDGRTMEIDARDLVIGDVIRIEAGDRIPADARVINAIDLQVDESILTGESTPVNKETGVLDDDNVLADRKNMLYMATSATYGKCTAIVTSTGMETELGKIATRIQEIVEGKTPLQGRLDKAGKQIGVIVLILCFIIFATGLINGVNPVTMFLTAVSLAVAAVPEGLPAVVTITLARGMRRMVKRNALVRKLTAVETLGATTVICTDKTGTLTRNEMTVRKIYVNNKTITVTGEGYIPDGIFRQGEERINPGKGIDLFLEIGALCNNASLFEVDGRWDITGDPTEASLLVAAQKANIYQDKLNEEQPRVYEMPFTSERKRMATVHEKAGKRMVYVKGAPDVLLDLCTHLQVKESRVKLTEDKRKEILDVSNDYAESALRLLGCAYKELGTGEEIDESRLEKDLVFVGLAGMIDPPREEVRDSIRICREAGIKPVMITGDHALTAEAIAKEIGMFEEGDFIVTGKELDLMEYGELKEKVEHIRIYARTNPEHKLTIVSALKENGHIVAMTGDGVNDAPALKKADIGVAMGITGTDVSKEASDMILLDDNFTSIVAAVEEGRGIYDNILLFIRYLLSCNIGEVLTVFLVVASLMAFGESPLIPLQILWMNVLTDAAPAIALGFNSPDPDVMGRKPRDPKRGIITRESIMRFIGIGSLMAVGAILMFYLSLPPLVESQGLNETLKKPRTIAFTTLVMFQLFYVLSCRSSKYPLFKVGIFSNKYLIAAVLFSVLMQVFVVNLDIISATFSEQETLYMLSSYMLDAFETTSLSLNEWLIITLVSSTAFIFPELLKSRNLK